MRRQYTFIVLLFTLHVKGTFLPGSQGPVSMAGGRISSFKTDPFSSHNSAGALAMSERSSISISYQSQYFVEGLNNVCAAGNFKLRKTQTLGMAYSFFGNGHYNESLLKVSLSKKFSTRFGAGISIDYFRLQLPQETSRVKRLLTCEAGIYVKLSEQLDLAIQTINPIRVQLSSYRNEKLTSILNTSIFYRTGAKFTLAAEWSQVMTGKGNLRIGIEYIVSNKFIIRTGAFNKPMNPCLGVSFMKKNISIHLAFAFHPFLNNTSAGGLTYWL